MPSHPSAQGCSKTAAPSASKSADVAVVFLTGHPVRCIKNPFLRCRVALVDKTARTNFSKSRNFGAPPPFAVGVIDLLIFAARSALATKASA
jgi:hypothetical protein